MRSEPAEAARSRTYSEKRVLLIDAVTSASSPHDPCPLANVTWWFARWLRDIPGVALQTVVPEQDLAAALREQPAGVILSGSPRDAWREDPINDKLMQAILHCKDSDIPFLGICYGHQLLARTLGGIVGRHPLGLELGNTTVQLTNAGRTCCLFDGLRPHFEVLSSHLDAVLTLPPDCELTVTGSLTMHQGFHWNNQLFGVQFHPEMDPEVLRFLWKPRIRTWQAKTSFDLNQRLASLRPTPKTGDILRNFVCACPALQ
jgi:GMP synthase (glutamine-hydrolysing)